MGQRRAFLVARSLLVGQLGKLGANAVDPLVGQTVRSKVGLGEQAVVISGFLHAHHDGTLRRRVPMARFLVDLATLFKHLGLTANLISQAVVQILERVHILELGLHARFSESARRRSDTLPSQRMEPSSMEQSEMPMAK